MDTIAEVLSEQCPSGSPIKSPQFPFQLCPLSFCLAYLLHWLSISVAPSIGSLVKRYSRLKTPCRGSHVKYRVFITCKFSRCIKSR